jgi:alpha-tubulin suppressor-like RCC1 family protein
MSRVHTRSWLSEVLVRRRIAIGAAAIVIVGMSTSGAPADATTATSGSVWAWGFNAVGQVGDGTLAMTAVPKRVSGLSDVTEVQGNGDNGFALTSSGTVYDWGLGAQGNLGNGTSVPYSKVPVQVTGLTGVIAVCGSGGGSTGTGYALESDGTVWAWGYGTGGALGNGSTSSSAVPVEVSTLTNVTAIAGGGPIGGTAYALESNGTVWAWGVGADGELGDASKASTSTPVQVRGITNAVSIAAGELGGYAVLATGRVMAWGEARIGTFQDGSALGNGSYATTDVPVLVRKVTGVTDVAAGGGEAFAVTSGGRVWAWGDGNLGNGTDNGARIPVLLTRITGVKAVGTDISAGFALKTNGTVWSWGSSYYGEVGNGTLGGRYQAWPEPIRGLKNVIGIAASAPFAIVG